VKRRRRREEKRRERRERFGWGGFFSIRKGFFFERGLRVYLHC